MTSYYLDQSKEFHYMSRSHDWTTGSCSSFPAQSVERAKKEEKGRGGGGGGGGGVGPRRRVRSYM